MLEKTEPERIDYIKRQFGKLGKYISFDATKITKFFKKQHISPTFLGKVSLFGDSAHA